MRKLAKNLKAFFLAPPPRLRLFGTPSFQRKLKAGFRFLVFLTMNARFISTGLNATPALNLSGGRVKLFAAAFSFEFDLKNIPPNTLRPPLKPQVTDDGVCQFGSSPRNGGLRAVCGLCSDIEQPKITWWTAAVGGIAVGTGPVFNPLIAGTVDARYASQTTYYAQCECSGGVSPRAAGVFTVYALSNLKIAGAGMVCPQALSLYALSGVSPTSTYAWTLSGGGSISQSASASASIQWANLYNGDGPFSLKATETTVNGCTQTVEQTIYIRQTALACIGALNVSLNANCTASLRVEDLLTGARTGASDMKLQLIRGDGYILESGVDSILVDGVDPFSFPYTYKGKTLQYKITETCSGSVCTGFIRFENKQAPISICPPDQILSCVQVPAISAPPASLTGMPQVSDCTPAVVNYRDVVYDQNCSSPFTSLPSGIGSAHIFPPYNDVVQIIDRIFTLTSAAGASSTCEQLIYVRKANIDHTVCPLDITFNCTESADLSPKITGYPLYDIDGDPATLNDRFPLAGSVCNIAVSYEDKTVPLCKGSFQIWRTWTIIDVCSNAAPKTCIQIIKVLDKTPPAVTAYFTQFYTDPATRIISSVDTSAAFDGFFIQTGAQSAGAPQDVWALGSMGDCGGKVSFLLRAKDPNCTGGPVAISANDTRISLRNPAQFNAATGETTFQFDAVYGQQGDFTATFTASDVCGYALAKKTFIIHIRDNIKPTPVCVQTLKVSLGSDGTASIYAHAFDDGSRDNCGISSVQVRRITVSDANGFQVANPDQLFYDQIVFDCRDLTPASILVAMRVTDYAGNFNDCMVQTVVENKIPPTCIKPVDKKIDCVRFDSLGLESFGRAVFTDNCGLRDTGYTVVRNLDNCRMGTIVRRWLVTGKSGLKDSCSQTITLTPVSDFTVDFPDDLILACFSDVVSADSLKKRMLNNPSTADGHIINNGCGVIGVQVKDDTIIASPDACFKILRRITVVDWCKYNPNNSPATSGALYYGQPVAGDVHSDPDWAIHNQPAWQNLPRPVGTTPRDRLFRDADGLIAPGYDPKVPGAVNSYADGIISYTQIIKIIDTVPPVILCPADKILNDLSIANCAAPFSDTLQATDLCESGQASGSPLTYRWTISAPDGTIVRSGDGAQTLPISLWYKIPYKIQWQVADACGNRSGCSYMVTARDAKKPTVLCRDVNASLARLSDGTGKAFVSATDLLASNLSDNCTTVDSLNKRLVVVKASESVHVYPAPVAGKDYKSVVFTCDDQDKTIPVELWTMDDAGNADFCVAHVTVQDNLQQACRTIIQSAVASGDVQTENQQTVQHTTVTAHTPTGAWAGEYSTIADGVFSIANLRLGQTYQLSAANNEQPLNGVTTFDIALVGKHILGVQSLNSPYKLIAADVNRDGDISAVDMLQMRKLILHIIPVFPNNSSWRFIDKKYVFQYPDNPFAEDFRENISLDSIPANAQANFIGVKIGDVNGTARPNSLQNVETRHTVPPLNLHAEDRLLEPGKMDTLRVTADAFSASGFQFTLHFNDAEVVDVIPGDLPGFTDANFGMFKNDLTVSWNGATGGTPPTLFNVVLKAKKSVRLSETTTLGSNLTFAEAFNATADPMDVNLQFRSAANEAFVLYPNEPNPFNDATRISFSLPEPGLAKLTVFDATGRILYAQQNDFHKGYNEIRLSGDAFAAQGVLFYRLDAGGRSAVRKMVKIE